MKKIDLLGSIVVVAIGGRGCYIYWAKGHRVFSAIHLKTNCAAQENTVKLHLVVEWILSWSLTKKAHWCSVCGPMLKVRPTRWGEGMILEQKGHEGELMREVRREMGIKQESRWERKLE